MLLNSKILNSILTMIKEMVCYKVTLITLSMIRDHYMSDVMTMRYVGVNHVNDMTNVDKPQKFLGDES